MKKIIHRTAIVVIASIFLVMFLVFVSGAALAADPLKLDPNVAIPGDDFKTLTEIDFTNEDSTKPIALYIRALFKYGIGVVGVLSSVVLMWGGVIWLTAGGNASRIGEAKAWIGGALTGLILALSSFLLLSTINPELVNLKVSNIKPIQNIPIVANEDEVCGESVCEINQDCVNGTCVAHVSIRGCCEISYNKPGTSREWCNNDITTVDCVAWHSSLIAASPDRNTGNMAYSFFDNGSVKYSCVQDKCYDSNNPCFNKDKVSQDKNGVKGYCLEGDWFQAGATGAPCSSFSADYECLNGDCQMSGLYDRFCN